MIPRQIPRQRDFSAGELDESIMRRDDTPLMRAGGRQMSNKRIRASAIQSQRPGRRALFLSSRRIEEIKIGSTRFRFTFGIGTLTIYDIDGTELLDESGYPWAASTVSQIVFAQFDNDIVITFPAMTPLVATYDDAAETWSTDDFAFRVDGNGQKRTLFYRLSPGAITMQPSAVSGTVDIVFSEDVLVAGHVGTRMRYNGRQLTIDTVVDGQNGTATCNEQLFPTGRLIVSIANPTQQFAVGEVVEGETSGARAIIITVGESLSSVTAAVAASAGTGYVVGNLLTVQGGTATEAAILEVSSVGGAGEITGFTVNTAGFYTVAPTNPVTLTGGDGTGATANLTMSSTTSTIRILYTSHILFTTETLVGPNGTATITTALGSTPGPTTVWDEEVVNDLQGWPRSVSVDQRRLIFADLPAIPGAIMWSAIDTPTDFYVGGAEPADAISEIVPSKDRVLHVIPGNDEFVFTRSGIYYIPISETNPLVPGSVAFRPITAENPAVVRPIPTPHGTVYVAAGLNQLLAIVPTGQTAQPYLARELASFHSELLSTPIALAFSAGTSQFPERYLYVLNDDGTVAVGRYDSGRDWVGFVPWTPGGDATFLWVSAHESTVLFCTSYVTPAGNRQIAEELDSEAWLDANVEVNDPPAALASAGLGPLWFFADMTVNVMQNRRYLGTRAVDSDGNLVAAEGEDLTADGIAAGFAWEEIFEPFIPHAQEGRSAKQTMRRRRIAKLAVTVQNNGTGFLVRKVGASSGKRIAPYRTGDNEAAAPELREQTHYFKILGRSVDPRVEIVKDVPGPLRIVEFAVDVGV